jgi:hypothetical protein
MNKYDIIRTMADANGKAFKPFRDTTELKDYFETKGCTRKVPYFCINRHQHGSGYSIDAFDFEHHDNAPRMKFYCDFLQRHVIPNIAYNCDASGVYPIELHDTHTYLGQDKGVYDNVFVFAKDSDDRMPCLVPDPYMIANYGGRLQVKDTREFEAKEGKVVFCGGTTGSMDPKLNERIQVCQWGATKPFAHFGITNIVQIKEDIVYNAYPQFRTQPFMSQEEQYKYKYILSIDGNTACWDRLMWIASSKSLAFKYDSKQILWYYPLLMEDQHFAGVTSDTMEKKYNYFEANPAHAKWIINNANHFVNTFANANAATMYMAHLLEAIAANKP